MSLASRFQGRPVSAGTAAGQLQLADPGAPVQATADEVQAAFAAVAAERQALATRLRAAGRDDEAGIVEIGALIAADPALGGPAVAAVQDGADAVTAVREAAERQAAVLAALPNPDLAERAGDVRQIGAAVLDWLSQASVRPPEGEFILVRREVSPVDLIELAEAGLTGAVSVTGGASSHAAIIARGLGIPMISGVDAAVLTATAGQPAFLDAEAGELLVGEAAVMAQASRVPVSRSAAAEGGTDGPARTADGRLVTVLCNVASAAETRRGLAAGAAGVGLLRTEIPFTQAQAWPTRADQQAQLGPILELLAGRPATVRLLDFSGDKSPPFLREAAPANGLTALLARPGALADQMRAVLEAGREAGLAVLIPMVAAVSQVHQVRAALAAAAAAVGVPPPRLGIMVELQATALAAPVFAAVADFFSIGTNDLTGQVLRIGRGDPAARPALAAHPQVLALVHRVTEAARRAGISVSVCGDAAADPLVLPLLIGLGVDTLSVPAARVAAVRAWIAQLDTAACAVLAVRALAAATADEVWKLVPPL
jgi:phosphoenolpyruvate-protein kinase (PTS system EI component)